MAPRSEKKNGRKKQVKEQTFSAKVDGGMSMSGNDKDLGTKKEPKQPIELLRPT